MYLRGARDEINWWSLYETTSCCYISILKWILLIKMPKTRQILTPSEILPRRFEKFSRGEVTDWIFLLAEVMDCKRFTQNVKCQFPKIFRYPKPAWFFRYFCWLLILTDCSVPVYGGDIKKLMTLSYYREMIFVNTRKTIIPFSAPFQL